MISLRRSAAAVACAGVVGIATAPSALAATIDLDASGVTDVVGVAWSRSAGRLFVGGASGAVAVLDKNGRLLGKVTFPAQVQSLEALAVKDQYLYVGDIGDQRRKRDHITVYRLPADEGQQSFRAWDFSYPDGAHDAKALMISGKGRVYVVTDGDRPGVYRAGDDPSRTEVNELVRVTDAPAGVTDGTFLDDGTTMLLRTAKGVEKVDALTFRTTDTTTYSGAPEGESITQFAGNRMLVGGKGVLRDEPLPSGQQTVRPELPSGPSPSIGPSASASQSAPPATPEATPGQPPGEEGVSRAGTVWALLGAVAVAVLAGAATFIVRD